MIVEEIRTELFRLRDEKYRDFQGALIPTVERERIIGVKTPTLRRMAKELSRRSDIEEFLLVLPHKYFDENQLHAFLISLIKDYETCLKEVDRFLPYINNWGTCDQLSPKVFVKHKDELIISIKKWIKSNHTYTIRFAIGMLLALYLDDSFKEEYMELVSKVKSEEYYINMMIAWYFATALAKQYQIAIKYIEEKKLSPWVHNKTIQKAIESYRISEEQKTYLRTLKLLKK